MSEQDFDQHMISENIAIIQIPIVITARSRTSVSTNNSKQNTNVKNMELKNKAGTQNIKIEQLLYGNENNKENEYKQQVIKQLNTVRNLHKFKQNVQHKLEIKKKQIQEKQLEGCTFQPQINDNHSKKRTLNQFLQAQIKFTKRVHQNKSKLKSNLAQEINNHTFKPKINRSVNYHNTKQSVHQKLYNLRKNQSNKNSVINQVPNIQYNFNPVITQKAKSIVRDHNISQHLYQDALRRQQNIKQQKQNNNISLTVENRSVNILNEKYIGQKFIKQYLTTLEDLDINDHKQQISYQKLILVLQKMNFVPVRFEQNSNYQTSCKQIYQYLNKYYFVNTRNLCIFLMALIGIYHINPINFGQNTQSQSQVDRELNLEESQGRKLQKRYDLLFRNRISTYEAKKPNAQTQYSFKPQINENSQKLADTYRNKMLQQTNSIIQNNSIHINFSKDGYISHADLLNLNKMTKEFEKNKKRQEKKDEDLKNCTFKPNITDTKKMMNSSKFSQSSFLGKKKYQQLYQISKNTKKVNKNSSEIQFQRNEKECTFAPKINKRNQNQIHNIDKNEKAKDYDKAIYRMVEGRKIRHQKKKFLSIHEDVTQIQDKKFKQQQIYEMNKDLEQQEIPFLVIDVNLGEDIQQIMVYQDQIQDSERIAEQFAKKHNLDSQSKKKLRQLLQLEINNIVNKIQQQEED